ncbi:unnamed protein product [Chrysoparadoxa australica]
MHERLDGERSFYYPYLRMLDSPYNLRHWSKEELAELQDVALVHRCKSKAAQVRGNWERIIGTLTELYPHLFNRESYSWEMWDWAWGLIQSRAFGRRLPWSALVPLADCLNHGNVQTKYQLRDGVFTLFPTGHNAYLAGNQVLNSYGRRSNSNLLLEYGFAIKDNQHDEVEVRVSLQDHFNSNNARGKQIRAFLNQRALRSSRTILLTLGKWPRRLIEMYRAFNLTASQMKAIEEAESKYKEKPGVSQEHKEDREKCLPSQQPKLRITWRGLVSFPDQSLSLENEASALRGALERLQQVRFPTSLEHDEGLLEQLQHQGHQGEACHSSSINALRYRVTRKKILRDQVRWLEEALAVVRTMEGPLSKCASWETVGCCMGLQDYLQRLECRHGREPIAKGKEGRAPKCGSLHLARENLEEECVWLSCLKLDELRN